jgi:hypothetical protein
MVDEKAPTLARRLTAHARVLRRGRIFARLREGWAYDEIASQERLTPERVRKIVRQAFERRIIDDGADHAKLQLTRLRPTMRIASDAIAGGDIKAIGPLLKVLDRLDHITRPRRPFRPTTMRRAASFWTRSTSSRPIWASTRRARRPRRLKRRKARPQAAKRRRRWATWRTMGSLNEKTREGSAQAPEKARFEQGNPRESKGFFVAFHKFSRSNGAQNANPPSYDVSARRAPFSAKRGRCRVAADGVRKAGVGSMQVCRDGREGVHAAI